MITRKDIIHYRKMSRIQWHDQAWHTYMCTRKAEAIGFAIQTGSKGYDKICRDAEGYLAIMQ